MSFQTIPEFLETYRLSRATLYRLVARKELRLVKLGRSTRIDRAQAEAWARNLPSIGDVPSDPIASRRPSGGGR